MKKDLIAEVVEVASKKKLFRETINCFIEAAKKESKAFGMKVVLAALVAALNFSALVALAAPAPSNTEWEKTVAAARQEGQVVVTGPPGADVRDALTEGFQKKYPGIRVDYDASTVRDFVPRIVAERKAGQFLWDVFVHGSGELLIPMGAFDPIEPALILPDIKDPKTWRGGKMEFLDPGKMIIIMTPFQRGTIFYNTSTKVVNPKEFKSYKDLLDPKWKGKIVADDPRRPGPGQATFALFALHPELGADFIRALGKQQLTFLRDWAQEVDLVAQGKYPLLIGVADFVANAKAKQGVPIGVIDPRQLKEGSDQSPADGTLALFNRAPHPNAAKVYINWLLSKEGQTIFTRPTGYISSRLDVPTDHAPAWRVPQPGSIKTYTKAALQMKDKDMLPLLQEVFGR